MRIDATPGNNQVIEFKVLIGAIDWIHSSISSLVASIISRKNLFPSNRFNKCVVFDVLAFNNHSFIPYPPDCVAR
jgi:hypothetical protein